MWNPFKKQPPVVISRNELRVLLSRQCDNQDYIPLDMQYTLVPDFAWLSRRRPLFPRNIRDCNQRACITMAALQSHCVGMCVVSTENPMIDHCLMIVCMEDERIMLYDPSLNTLSTTEYYTIKRIWL